MRKLLLVFLFIGALFAPLTALAQDFSVEEEARIKALALEAILDNPEIIEEAIMRLQTQEAERQQVAVRQALKARREDLENDRNAPVLGNPNGDVTLIEFFDYNCPYCKRAMDPIKALLVEDDQVRLVYREWPILGEGSVFAARAALAARKQGRYEDMHWALMSGGRADEQSTIATAKRLGLDLEQLRADMRAPEVDAHIAMSMELAGLLNITGTPSFVIGDTLAPGLIPFDRLVELVDTARSNSRQ